MTVMTDLAEKLATVDYEGLVNLMQLVGGSPSHPQARRHDPALLTEWRAEVLRQAAVSQKNRDAVAHELGLPTEHERAERREERLMHATEMAAMAALDSSAMARASAEAARESVRIADSSLRLAESVRRLTWIAVVVAGVSAIAQVIGLINSWRATP